VTRANIFTPWIRIKGVASEDASANDCEAALLSDPNSCLYNIGCGAVIGPMAKNANGASCIEAMNFNII